MINRFKINTLLFLYLSLFVTGLVLVWFPHSPQTPFSLYNFGKVLGVWGLTSLSVQFILSSRFKPLEKGVGLNNLITLHSFNAKFMLVTIIFHPICLKILRFFSVYSFFHWLGLGALLLLILDVVTTLFSKSLKLDYEKWKVIHKLAYVIFALGFIHSLFLGSDIILKGPLFYWWMFLLFLGVMGIVTRIFKEIFEYNVVEIKKENENVWTIELKNKNKAITFSPGQFAFVRFFGSHISSEEHHFTISSSPNDKYLSFTIKNLGDFTSQISKVKKGDKALVDGPYGVFSNTGISEPLLFVAGGIGITPVISMLKAMDEDKTKSDSTLIYNVSEEKDLVFKKELDKLAQNKWLKVIYKFTKKDGHITNKDLKNVKDLTKRHTFLVGPEKMVANVKKELLNLKVPKSQIYTEKFSLK